MKSIRIVLSALGLVTVFPATASAGALRAGECGPRVSSLQRSLSAIGYAVGAVDGCYGTATSHGVRAFQQAEGLRSTGVAGEATLRALRGGAAPRPAVGGRGTHLEVDLRLQLLLVVHEGELEKAYAISTGHAGFETPRGRFRVTRKEVRSWSVPYGVWLPWASYFNQGIAIHAGAIPGYPASHGCVRVPAPFAAAIYRRMPVGTAVIVR